MQAIAFLAADEDRLTRFLGLTGITPDTLRQTAHDPAGLGAVLDYLLGWEPLLLDFAGEIGVKPEAIARARQKLPGAPTY